MGIGIRRQHVPVEHAALEEQAVERNQGDVTGLGQAAFLEGERQPRHGADSRQGTRSHPDEDGDVAFGDILLGGLARRFKRAAAVEVGGGQALDAEPPSQQSGAVEKGGILGGIRQRFGRQAHRQGHIYAVAGLPQARDVYVGAGLGGGLDGAAMLRPISSRRPITSVIEAPTLES